MGYWPVTNSPSLYAFGVGDMKRLCVLLCALLFGFGCATGSDEAMWDGALKDLRGDNMQMRSGFSEMKETEEYRSQSKYRD